jgi:hypothetical protein
MHRLQVTTLTFALVHGKIGGINRGNWSTKASACPNSPMELQRIGVLVHEIAAMAIDHGSERGRFRQWKYLFACGSHFLWVQCSPGDMLPISQILNEDASMCNL